MASLVNYSGSSSEEDVVVDSPCSAAKKQKLEENTSSSNLSSATKIVKHDARSEESRQCMKGLPLPSAIQQMFGEGKRKHEDKPGSHGGRVRTFPHMEGNWASYVYIPVSPDKRLQAFLKELLLCLQPLNFQLIDDPHISLSRTVCIRHHWIEPLTESLKDQFHLLESCLCDIQTVKLFTNDEKTRTFLSLAVLSEGTKLLLYTAAIDTCFKEFKLPSYYQNPSYHMSILWCVGDVMSQITDTTRHKLQVSYTSVLFHCHLWFLACAK